MQIQKQPHNMNNNPVRPRGKVWSHPAVITMAFVLVVCLAFLISWACVSPVSEVGYTNPDPYTPPLCQNGPTFPGLEKLYRNPGSYEGRCYTWDGRVTQRITDNAFFIETGFSAPYADGRILVIGDDECLGPPTPGRVLEGDHVNVVGTFSSFVDVDMVGGSTATFPRVECTHPRGTSPHYPRAKLMAEHVAHKDMTVRGHQHTDETLEALTQVFVRAITLMDRIECVSPRGMQLSNDILIEVAAAGFITACSNGWKLNK